MLDPPLLVGSVQVKLTPVLLTILATTFVGAFGGIILEA